MRVERRGRCPAAATAARQNRWQAGRIGAASWLRQHQHLADQVLAKAIMRCFLHKPVTGLVVNARLVCPGNDDKAVWRSGDRQLSP
ncbi:hypothetical protein D3C72_2052380 [compost metagenome]